MVTGAVAGAALAQRDEIELGGEWRFELDEENVGEEEGWFSRDLEEMVRLPGTTDSNLKGIRNDEDRVDRLTRVWTWKGAAWYQRDVEIPESWEGKRVTLFFERSKNSRIWIDDTFSGWENTLSAPQIFDITDAVKPGVRTISVLIDNSKLPPGGPSHAVDERTQTNWNGIIGEMELRATDPVWIEEVRVYPDVSEREARVRVVVGNITGEAAEGNLTVGCRSENVENPEEFAGQVVDFRAPEERNEIEFIYKPGGEVPLWDEFDPALLRLELSLEAVSGESSHEDTRTTLFGMREFTREGSILKNNGETVFLRGRIDCANYPLTGHPPMDEASWMGLMRIHKDWGLNHVRYHSWCPPAAAFAAADRLGIYIQAELPNKRSAFNAPENEEAAYWNIDRLDVETTETDVSLYDYARREGDLILEYFGNSPSFAMFTLGNELGRREAMFELVEYFRQQDTRHLYAQGSNNMHWKPSLAEGDDFWVTGKVEKDARPLRGSSSSFDLSNPHINNRPPSTEVDYSGSIEGIPVPLVGHETGQFQVSPDFSEIAKYTGVLEARNLEIFRERLEKAGMLDQADDFFRASGALAAICYREDVEAALRTEGFGGFQLLDLMDFPGQGTALVGMLNAFMESKGIIEPEEWREFCSETVPLFRMEKYAWTAGETLEGKLQVAHYGPAAIEDAVVRATVTDAEGNELASTVFPETDIARGGVRDIGGYSLNLDSLGMAIPGKIELNFRIKGTPHVNRYPIWVYPEEVDTGVPEGVMIATSHKDEKTREHLAAGGRVLLLPTLAELPHSVEGSFQTEFWSPMFAQSAERRGKPKPPGTLGILCDPEHPALAAFPTAYHSDWQWWHLVKNSRPVIYDGSPDDFRPIVQAIDNFDRNHKLGLIAETRVGDGTMLICSIDLLGLRDRPEARQLLRSLLDYAGSEEFSPEYTLERGVAGEIVSVRESRGRLRIDSLDFVSGAGLSALFYLTSLPRKSEISGETWFQPSPALRNFRVERKLDSVPSLSSKLFAVAKNHIPGGVNSPVRAFRNVGGEPFFVRRAKGSRITDIDGKTYIDYIGSWGPNILGHAPVAITNTIHEVSKDGISFGIPNPFEVEMARTICDWVPSVGKVRVTSSGTEATMSAIRLARGFTGRDFIVKFVGCYHGHSDSLLVAAGSGALTHGEPDSAGVPASFAEKTIVLPYNDGEAVERLFREEGRADCGSDRGVLSRECRSRVSQARLPRFAFFDHERIRCAADFRRGDDRLPARQGGGAGAGKPRAGSILFRKSHRRRSSGGGVWRACGGDGLAGTGRSGLSGGHALRESARNGRRTGPVARALRRHTGRLRPLGPDRIAVRDRPAFPVGEKRHSPPPQPRRLHVLSFFHRPRDRQRG